MQVQEQMFIGASYYERFTRTNNVKMPSEIRSITDARYNSTAHDSHINDRLSMKIREIIMDFDSFAEEQFEKIKSNAGDAKYINHKKALSELSTGLARTEELIQIYDSVLNRDMINPIRYINAKKHFLISKIVFSKFGSIDMSKINFEELELKDEHMENFKLGAFIGLEPMIVICMFHPLHRDDPDLDYAYAKLVDTYSRIVAKEYTEQYLKETGLDRKIEFKPKVYAGFLDFLEVERHGPVLL